MYRLIGRSLALTLSLFVSFAASALDEKALAAFEAFVAKEMKLDRTVGLSVAVLEGGQLWAKGFGHADVENQVPATEKSSYRMASVSKPMTAVAAIRLAEMGKLDLDAPIQTYVSYFPRKDKPVSIRQLLAHLGGISHYRNYSVEGNIREPKTTRESIAIFENFDLVNEPGSTYSYSSYGYNLVGAAIEGATGRSYADVMRELVWGPAGMTDTRMDSPTEIIPHRVTGYRLDENKLRRSDFVDISSRFAAGGTRSTVVDMVRFARAVDEGKLLKEESVERMWWPMETTAGRSVDYGLGWSVHAFNGHYQVAHSGSQQEARTLLIYFPARDLAMAFASNFEDVDFSRYRNYLYWAATGEVWVPPLYAGDAADRLAIDLADQLVDNGGLYFEKYGRALTTDRRELQKAFASLQAGQARPLLAAGSWIVSKAGLGEGDHSLSVLRRYVESRQQPRFDRAMERRIVELSRVWESAWTQDRKMSFLSDRDAEQLVAGLQGLRIAPNYDRLLVEDVERSFRRGDAARAARLSRLAADTYPASHFGAGVYGVFLALTGKEEEAESWLRRSVQADANGYASPGRLLAISRDVRRMGEAALADALLRVARRVHPAAESLK